MNVNSVNNGSSVDNSFRSLSIPPALISFTIAARGISGVVSPRFGGTNGGICLLYPICSRGRLPLASSLLGAFGAIAGLSHRNGIGTTCAPAVNNVTRTVVGVTFNGNFNFGFGNSLSGRTVFSCSCNSFLIRASTRVSNVLINRVASSNGLSCGSRTISLGRLLNVCRGGLRDMFGYGVRGANGTIRGFRFSTGRCPAPTVGITGPGMLVPMFPNAGYRFSSTGIVHSTNTRPVVFIVGGRSDSNVRGDIRDFTGRLGADRVVFVPNNFSNNSRPSKDNGFVATFFHGTTVGRNIASLLSGESNLVYNVYGNFRTLVGLNLIPCNGVVSASRGYPALAFGAVTHRRSHVIEAEVTSGGSP